ncbi:MAG: DUF4358 domain-containing protein [Candidatus Faecivicinus sp.]
MKKLCSILLLAAMLLTLTACGGKETKAVNVNLTDVMTKFSLGEEMMTLTADDLRDMYGIDAADVKQFAAAINSTGIKCDEIILIEAAGSDAAARVKTALDNRYQAKLNETENYLPDEYAIIKTCSVTANGNFVAMIVAANAADLTKTYTDSLQ